MTQNEHIALYRKYRPKNFKEVIGQDHIVSVISSAIKNNSIAHAYLFTGTRGTGKTTIARIFAHEIGCTDKDLYEIDAASNRGIDDIRDLREGVSTLPFESPYKVYIIDEVHMLTKEAFNALLKTLEEPPAHVVFMLATTEVDKLPDTILSRCQTHVMARPTRKILTDVVTHIATKEKYTLEKSSAELVATLADGSFRDAIGILQKVLSVSGDKKIEIEEVERVTGAPRGELVNTLIDAIAQRDSNKALVSIKEAFEGNIDMLIFQTLLLDKLRSVLLIRFASDMIVTIKEKFSETDFLKIEAWAKDATTTITSKTLTRLLESLIQTQKAHIKQLPLELALIDLIKGDAKK